jgi:hypothetical protein
MSVNGVEIEVGQRWRTRGGETTRIVSIDGTYYPYRGTIDGYPDTHCWAPDGRFDHTVGLHVYDLITLVKDGVTEVPDTPSALAAQVGGTHYKGFAIQPVEYIHANKLGFCEGNVVKYITRHAAKNGADDIRKVIHYCQLLLELQYGVKKEGV